MRNFLRATALVFLVTAAAACERAAAVPANDEALANNPPTPEAAQGALLAAVREATTRFHSTAEAVKAGYEPADHCVAAPELGGMGYHWVNPSLVDPVFDPLQPEVVLYQRGANGEMQLVAVEYIVIDVGQERPSFGGHLFDVGGTPVPVPHYSLHVWLYEANPNGMFTPFNPNVTCSESHQHGE